MDARNVGVSAAAAAAVGIGMHRSPSGRPNRGVTDLVTSGNYTWSPELDYLADGVTSSVYRCRDRNTGDFYAIKVFKTRPVEREIQLLQKLNHANIVRLISQINFYDSVGIEKTGLVLEYCSGNSLHEYLKKPDNKLGLDDADFLTLLYNMCDGLAYLREQQKIVHRDIKPGNIMITYDNRRQPVFKLADFGSSRELPDNGDFLSLVGTYEFLHPSIYGEVYNRMRTSAGVSQNRPAASPGHKAECDLWSLGVSFYMAATGRLPFAPFEGVRSNHAQMIDMMVKKPPLAISATQDSANGLVLYQDRLPPTCQLSPRLQQLLVTVLQGILVCDFKDQWTFSRFFETINAIKSQHTTYYFIAGCMLKPDLVFSQKQTLNSLLTSLSDATGYAREEIVVFYRSQAVSAFPTGSAVTSPVLVLSRQRFACTLEIGQLDFNYVKSRPREADPNQPKDMRDYVEEAHKQALACHQLSRVCHLNHALTLETKDAALSLLRSRGSEAYQRASAKVAMVSSSQQKVGRLIDLARLVGVQANSQLLRDQVNLWQRQSDEIGARLHEFRPEGRGGGGGGGGGGDAFDNCGSPSCGSLVMADELAAKFATLFARQLNPQPGAECLAEAFHRVEQVHERYEHMIKKYMNKDPHLLTELMRRGFPLDRALLGRCLDECQRVIGVCCVETLSSVRAGLGEWYSALQDEVTRLGKLEEGLRQEIESDLDMLHDRIFTSINDALTVYFRTRNATRETDIAALCNSIQELIQSTDLVQDEVQRNTALLKELDELGLRNSGLSSLDTQGSSESAE